MVFSDNQRFKIISVPEGRRLMRTSRHWLWDCTRNSVHGELLQFIECARFEDCQEPDGSISVPDAYDRR
jgi:hypothetical protein